MTTLDVHTKTPRAPIAAIGRVRQGLLRWKQQAPQVVSAARHRFRRPALTIGGLSCIDTAFFQHGLFAGLLVTGGSLFLLEWLSGDDQ